MTSGANGEWVRQGTPHDDNADWNEEQSEYGTAISPTEWDDYSSEQSVPVTPPRAQTDEAATLGSDVNATQPEHAPVPGQEPDAGGDYRSGGNDPVTEGDAQGDADEHGMEPVRTDEPAPAVETDDAFVTRDEPVADVHENEITRPRPVVPDASMTASAVPSPVMVEDSSEGVVHAETADLVENFPEDARAQEPDEVGERHIEAADYLAVDPIPFEQVNDEPLADHVDDEPLVVDADEDLTAHVDTDDELTGHVDTDEEATSHVNTNDMEHTEHVDTNDMENTQVVDTNDLEQTQAVPVDTNDMEHTQAVPVAAAAGVGATAATGGSAVPDGLYRAAGTEETAVISQDAYPDTDADVEEERRQASLEAERQAREQRLGAVPTSTDNAMRDDALPPRVSTDRFLPSFGLFVMRIVLAGVLCLASFQILGSGVDATANFLAGYPMIPEPRLVAWILGFTLGAMALLLVIGLLQRVVGFLLLAISVASLVFIRWGNFQIFTSGGLWVDGFIGDKDLLLAAIGLLLLTIGGGAWGIDGAFRRARAEARAEKLG